MMSRIFLLSVLFVFITCRWGWGQEEDVLKKPVHLERKQVTVPEALKLLEKEVGLLMAYPSSLVAKKPVRRDVSWRGVTLRKAIESLFPGQPLRLKIIGANLVIRPGKKKIPKQNLHGYILDSGSGEALIGAAVLVADAEGRAGTVSNQYGFYTLALPPGAYRVQVSYLGFETRTLQVGIESDQRRDISLIPNAQALHEVVVSAEANPASELFRTGSQHRLDVQQLKTQPAIAGEPDVMKTLQLLPGVTAVGEGSSGLYVRGGNIDQNLILLDEAPVYNPSHLLGFFSTFHPDAIRHVDLYKGNFPVEYGGRLSSVVNLRMKEGNKEQFGVEGGVGLLASRALLEGPIKKGKHSFMLAARRSYPDIFIDLFSSDDGGNKVRFFDLNGKLNFRINENNRLYLSAYNGQDVFRFFDAYENTWGNTTGTVRWNRIFNDRFFGNLTLVFSDYRYTIDNFIEGIETFNWESGVRDVNLKADFTAYLNAGSKVKFGMEHILHRFEPGRESRGRLRSIPLSRTLEQALYVGHSLRAGRWSLDYGMRLSAAHNLGQSTVYNFDESYRLLDSVQTGNGIYHSKFNFAPRLLLEYQMGEGRSLQAGFSRTIQYQQELRNSITGFNAFYAYLPSGLNIPAQRAEQASLGFNQRWERTGWSVNLELYYKWLHNQVDFVDHSSLLQNPLVEADLRIGSGRAYGVELLIKKEAGRVSGWLGYAYARSLRQIPGINDGKEYPAYYDQPHAASLLLQYQHNKRWRFAANWQYNSGGAATLPIGSYNYSGAIVPIYGARNAQRLPDYHRLDLSATLYRRADEKHRNQSYWVFSIFNAYYRKNTLSVDILPVKEAGTDNIPDPTDVAAFKTFVFGVIPSVSYNFKF